MPITLEKISNIDPVQRVLLSILVIIDVGTHDLNVIYIIDL